MIHARQSAAILCGSRRGQSVTLGGLTEWQERKARASVTCPKCRAILSRRGPKPELDEPRTERLQVRLTPAEREACEARAEAEGVAVGAWARGRMLGD